MSGHSSEVEHQPSKLSVAGSIPAVRSKYRDDMHGDGRAFEPGQYRNNFMRRRPNRRWRPNYGQWKWRIATIALMNF